MKPRYELIVFDWDGTLYDSTALITRCIQQSAVDLGAQRPSDQQAAYVIGMGLAQALAHAVPDLPAHRYPDLVERYKHHYLAWRDQIILFDGVVPMLHGLKERSHHLAVATGKSRVGLNDALQRTGLHPLFDATRTADETASKPDPQMLLELMEELAVPPERVLMVGDTSHDLLLARHAGVQALAVSYGAHQAEDLATYQPLAVVHSVQEMSDWFTHQA